MSNDAISTAKPSVILVADDEPVNRSLIGRRLVRAGYGVITARDGREAFERTREVLPDLVLMDVMMPVMDGLEACQLVKATDATRDIPVIFLSARDDMKLKVNGLALGANDYISKPFKSAEFLARIAVAIRLKRERDSLRAGLQAAHADTESAMARAMTDVLTGLLNRYGLERVLAHEYAESRRYHRPLSCLLIDLDHFKTVNDTYGHATGDLALQQVAAILTDVVRGADVACRYGGEEFLVLLPETNMNGALALAEKIRATTDAQLFGNAVRPFRLTLSIGAATLAEAESGADLISRADQALYCAKTQGRNRVENNAQC